VLRSSSAATRGAPNSTPKRAGTNQGSTLMTPAWSSTWRAVPKRLLQLTPIGGCFVGHLAKAWVATV